MNQKIKIKGKLKDNFLKVKFIIYNPMLTEKMAKDRQIKQDYVTHIIIKVGTRVLYELKPSENFSQNPLMKFRVKQKEIKLGDILEIEWKTSLGKSEHIRTEIQKVFKYVSAKS